MKIPRVTVKEITDEVTWAVGLRDGKIINRIIREEDGIKVAKVQDVPWDDVVKIFILDLTTQKDHQPVIQHFNFDNKKHQFFYVREVQGVRAGDETIERKQIVWGLKVRGTKTQVKFGIIPKVSKVSQTVIQTIMD